MLSEPGAVSASGTDQHCAACREVANAQQETAEKTEKYNQLEECLMT